MILITGATGFIGKHVLAHFIKIFGKENIVALTSNPIDSCNYLLHNNYNFNENYFIDSGYGSIETIVHIGAFTPKNTSEANNIELSNSNITNTFKLLSSKLANLEKVIFFSTLDVYKMNECINESTQELPLSLYGHSKLYCEKMITNWADQNNKSAQILRIGHVYGPGEEAYLKIIPETFKAILAKKTVKIWGAGEDLRSFIYIDDVVEATYNALNLNENPGIINVVGSQAISIKNLVTKIIEITGNNTPIEFVKTDAKTRNLNFDNAKLAKYLLKKETDLDVGLRNEYNYCLNLSK